MSAGEIGGRRGGGGGGGGTFRPERAALKTEAEGKSQQPALLTELTQGLFQFGGSGGGGGGVINGRDDKKPPWEHATTIWDIAEATRTNEARARDTS